MFNKLGNAMYFTMYQSGLFEIKMDTLSFVIYLKITRNTIRLTFISLQFSES